MSSLRHTARRTPGVVHYYVRFCRECPSMEEQLETARNEQGEGDLGELLHAGDTWTIT